jgi:hypothetical protein
MLAQTDWPALYLIVQILGFIGVIIAIVTATHKITEKFTELRKDVETLKEAKEKHENKLEEFTILYKTDIGVRQAREIQEKSLEEKKKRIKIEKEEKKEEESDNE